MAASDLNLLEQNNRASHSTTPGSIDEKSLYHSLTPKKANEKRTLGITPLLKSYDGKTQFATFGSSNFFDICAGTALQSENQNFNVSVS
jgi:hypothetical protein